LKPKLRLPVEGLQRGLVTLGEDEARYAVKVHRLRVGDHVQLFDPRLALEGNGAISNDRLPQVQVEVQEEPVPALVQNLPVILIQGVGKGDKPEQAVRDATVFGAERLIFALTERSVAKSLGEGKKERWLRVASQVARQCGRGDLPVIEGPSPLSEVLESLPEGYQRVVCAWSDDAVPLHDAVSAEGLEQGVALLIGPEGGLSHDEVEAARSHGFSVISLGPYVLRTEVACGAALSALRARQLAR
jgi:16S rRNA (uracil1498-N3)-methyltransferase